MFPCSEQLSCCIFQQDRFEYIHSLNSIFTRSYTASYYSTSRWYGAVWVEASRRKPLHGWLQQRLWLARKTPIYHDWRRWVLTTVKKVLAMTQSTCLSRVMHCASHERYFKACMFLKKRWGQLLRMQRNARLFSWMAVQPITSIERLVMLNEVLLTMLFYFAKNTLRTILSSIADSIFDSNLICTKDCRLVVNEL